MVETTLKRVDIAPASKPGFLQNVGWMLSDTVVMARRNILHVFRQPQLLILELVQPIIFVLLFTFVFGGAISFTTGGNYIDYLLPGIIVQTVIFAATETTVGLADDLSKGMIDRFRALPMSRAAVLTGRTLADALRSVVTIMIMLVVGILVGFSGGGGFWGIFGGIVISVLFGYAFTWISAWLGMIVKSPEAAQVAGFLWVFPLVFASSVFVPTATMPTWLQGFAENQPISVIANTVRDLFAGTPVNIAPALLWIAVILVIFIPLAVRQYNRRVN
jgi:ABC transporter DrrB family efflux protein